MSIPDDVRERVRSPASTPGETSPAEHSREEHSQRINQLRAGVLGANDGIVSVAGMVIGVAAATPTLSAIAVAGTAALTAGALSMAMGEFVSVSTQKDTETAMLQRTRRDLAERPEKALEDLTVALEETGVPRDLARQAAERMTAHDGLDAHARVRLGMDEDTIASPMHAAIASLVAFTIGGLLPLLAALLVPGGWRILATMLAVVVGLALTGLISARLGQAAAGRATVRTIIGGLLAMGVTYAIGSLLGVAGV
ncbi:VIT family protein [Brachybacterium sp. EF45031]|uniref:VIT1/CCC1 transporter family protein n=1 Tax=Brachybacterium sillae TaxID=2810536 RepID=UPI00217E8C80|nr:VIT family protein [Brachybacterium sillae]MCS6711455.1 VIT family protein [Brachybacterium sillae]